MFDIEEHVSEDEVKRRNDLVDKAYLGIVSFEPLIPVKPT
jgi:hypothetical protein